MCVKTPHTIGSASTKVEKFRNFWLLEESIYGIGLLWINKIPTNELFGSTAVCYASEPGLLVQGWELSAPSSEALVPAGLTDSWQYLLLLTYWSSSYVWVQLASVWYWVYLYSMTVEKASQTTSSSAFQGCTSELAPLVSLTRKSIADYRLIIPWLQYKLLWKSPVTTYCL